MRWFVCVVGTAALAFTSAGAWADAPNAAPVMSRPDSPLERAAQICNELWINHGTRAFAGTIVSGDTKSTTTTYCLGPLAKALDGTYAYDVKVSTVTHRPNEQPKVRLMQTKIRMFLEGQSVVFEVGASRSRSDFAELGNGLIFRERGVRDGHITSTESFRRRDGSYFEIQRYKGLTGTVTYEEVPVPPDLKGDVRQPIRLGLR